MKTAFYIVLNIQAGKDYEAFGKFMLGCDRKFAESLFHKLQGNRNTRAGNPIQIDFMEAQGNGLPAHLEVMGCTLQELGENCRLITKEMFKLLNMEAM